MVRARVAWTLLCVGWCGAAAAQGAQLEVRGESACIDAAVLRERIARYLDTAEVPSALAIEVDLSSQPAGFRVLRAGRVLAERRFERVPEICAEWRDAIALTIAVAIEHAPPPSTAQETSSESEPADLAQQPTVSVQSTERPLAVSEPPATASVEREEPEAEPASEPESEPTIEQESALEARSPPEPVRRPSERWMVHIGGAYLLEALPAPAAALRLGGEHALVPELRIGLAGLVSARIELPFEGGRVESQLFGGQATACLNTPLRPVVLLGCAGTSAGVVQARGRGYTRGLSPDMFWLGTFVRAALELPAMSTWAVRLVADAHVNLLRPELRLNRQSASSAHRVTYPIGGSFAIDLVLRLD